MYFAFGTRKTSKVLAFTKYIHTGSRGSDLSPDGRELLWVQEDSYSSDIALAENFR